MINQRFLRSKAKRTELFLKSDGLCSICKEALPISWHSDHKIPWLVCQSTKMSNLQATCPSCNLRKGNKMTTKINYENLNYFQEDFPNSVNVRICQIGAYNAAIHKLCINSELSCSIFLPTGTGKSDVVRSLSIGLKNRKLFSGTWVFSPSEDLRKQVAKDEVKECLERLGITFNMYYPFSEESSLDNERFRNSCVMESYTTQFLINGGSKKTNLDLFIEHDARIFKKTGKHVVAIFDESHLFSTDNTWGYAAIKLREAGIPIILVTGTPYRTDKIKIPGFNEEFIEEKEKPFTKTIINDGIVKIRRGIEKVSKWKLIADYEYTYQRAWEDKVILKPNPQWIDATEMVYNRIVSEMAKQEVYRIIRNLLFDDKTIEASVAATINSIRRKKIVNDKCCAIVTTLSDGDEFDGESFIEDDMMSNLHAKKIEREFKKQDPNIKVLIVTSTLNPDGLEKFKTGQYDVLIVKAMGTIGFNHKPIKTVCCLSSYRTLNALIQLVMRGCRVLDGINYFDVILPKDKAMCELWVQFIEETGLVVEYKDEIESHEESKEISENTEVEKKDSFFDNHNYSYEVNQSRNSSDEIIELFKKKLSHCTNIMTNQEMLDLYSKISTVSGEDWLQRLPDYDLPEFRNILLDPNEVEYRKRSEARELVDQLAHELMAMCNIKYNKSLFRNYIAPLWRCVKRISGFASAASMQNISGIDNYDKIINSCRFVKSKLNSQIPSDYFDHIQFLNNIRSIRP